MQVYDYIAYETERQSGTVREGLGMYGAWSYVVGTFVKEGQPLRADSLCHMYRLIKDVWAADAYRMVPAVFNQGVPAIDAQNIGRAMDALDGALLSLDTLRTVHHREGYTVGLDVPDYLTKEFLSIHPFTDGNGRVGSLLWNYLRGSLSDPEPMPYFYGGQ